VLQNYLLSSYSARRLGLQSTGNAGGVRNLLLQPGGEGGDNPLKAMQNGLYVTEVMGQGVSMVTGDHARGASGFPVVNGELCVPVDAVTIARTLREMFLGILLTGSSIDTRGNIHSGALLISDMTVAGS